MNGLNIWSKENVKIVIMIEGIRRLCHENSKGNGESICAVRKDT